VLIGGVDTGVEVDFKTRSRRACAVGLALSP
jgi:hypothetical protein